MPVGRFFAWCDHHRIGQLADIEPLHVAAYIEAPGGNFEKPTVKQHLAAIRMLFDWLVTGQVVATNPAHAVRGPKHVVKTGKTTVLDAEPARRGCWTASTPRPSSGCGARLSNQLDLKHPLIRLAALIHWDSFETEFSVLYHETLGRPGRPTRPMVGLTYLKHSYNLSDEQVCGRWLENPYWQFFCGFDYLQHRLPIEPSSLTRWRERIGASGMERLLAATVEAALAAGAVKPSSLERVTVDTTVQPKAIAFPLDSRLYHRGRETPVRLAARHGVQLRQSYQRLSKRALRLANRYAHARQMRRARREIKRLKTFLGRVARDIGRKIADRPALTPHFSQPLARVARLLAQQKTDHGKLYALHAPEVECLAKGKAHKRYEFGVKVSVAATNREGLVLGMMALPGNSYDGHTLAAALAQIERMTGVAVARAYVDRGYRGHGLDSRHVFISGQCRGVTATIRRELRRRSAIEPVTGHMKTDGRLDRNYLAGMRGDAINALLCGAGYNLRLILNYLRRLLRSLLSWLAENDRLWARV